MGSNLRPSLHFAESAVWNPPTERHLKDMWPCPLLQPGTTLVISVSLGWRVQPQGSANCPSWNSAPLTLSARGISRGRSPATVYGGPACSPLPRASAVQGQGPGKAQIPTRVMLCSLALLISLKNGSTVSCQQPFNFQDRCFCSYLESECEGNFGKKEQ